MKKQNIIIMTKVALILGIVCAAIGIKTRQHTTTAEFATLEELREVKGLYCGSGCWEDLVECNEQPLGGCGLGWTKSPGQPCDKLVQGPKMQRRCAPPVTIFDTCSEEDTFCIKVEIGKCRELSIHLNCVLFDLDIVICSDHGSAEEKGECTTASGMQCANL
jgi:hypothetical protein